MRTSTQHGLCVIGVRVYLMSRNSGDANRLRLRSDSGAFFFVRSSVRGMSSRPGSRNRGSAYGPTEVVQDGGCAPALLAKSSAMPAATTISRSSSSDGRRHCSHRNRARLASATHWRAAKRFPERIAWTRSVSSMDGSCRPGFLEGYGRRRSWLASLTSIVRPPLVWHHVEVGPFGFWGRR